MFDDMSLSSRICAAVGATVALFATFLPWYSYEVVIPIPPTLHVFAVTTTLWGFTTLAPILIIVGATVALIFLGAAGDRLAGAAVGLLGLGVLVYAVVRCFDIPSLGVVLLPAAIAARVAAVTQLEGGPFVELVGGAMMAIGGLGALFASRVTSVPVERTAPGGWRETPGSAGTPHTA
jgi:hypothetical protein